VIVLREGAHLCGRFACVEAEDLFEHERVCHAVRQMVERTELVSHRVAYAEEGVGKCHTCHCGGVCHLLTRLYVGQTVVICAGEVFEYHLERLNGKPVGIIGSHYRCISLKRVRDRIYAGGGGESARRGHVEIGIDYRHVGKQLVVCKWVLNAGVLIGDNGKGSDLRACAGRRGNCDEISLLAHLGEGVNALADIHKAHCHVGKINLRMLVHDPHDLCGVHCGAAAERDYNVGGKGGHLRRAFFGAGKRRVGSNIEKFGMRDAKGFELVRYRLGVAVVVEE